MKTDIDTRKLPKNFHDVISIMSGRYGGSVDIFLVRNSRFSRGLESRIGPYDGYFRKYGLQNFSNCVFEFATGMFS
jgi:hypothetical protein